jgi:MIP family channel proteins
MTMKRYAGELVGTFVVVFAPVAYLGSTAVSGGKGSLLEAALISGLAVLVMIATFGPISAAHFNPAVTLGFAVSGRFPWKHVVPYWVSQVLGSAWAAGLGAYLFGAGPGVHLPAQENLGRNLGVEIAITFILMLVIMAMATDKRVNSSAPAPAIGFAVVIGVLIGGPITGGSMNPVRSLGPALFAGGPALSHMWLYVLGPVLGAVAAALLYERLRLHPEHASSAPGDF